MIEIPLTQDKMALIDDLDFPVISQFKWCAQQIGSVWYASTGGHRGRGISLIHMHRLIMEARSGQEVDHRNRNGLDNQRSNLRFCTRSQNNANAGKRRNTKSGFKGVSWDRQTKKWRARIACGGKHFHLGRFESQEEAARIYDTAAQEKFGEFARLNFRKEI